MPTTQRKKPYIWVTWLTGLLAGKQLCEGAVWFKAHYKYDKLPSEDFDAAAWSVEHDALVREHAKVLEADGRFVTFENQNSFHLHGETAILAGKPDLISKKHGTSLRVSDGKSGEQHPSHWWQVVLYLIAIPMAWKIPNMRIHGEVFYRTGQPIYIELEEITPTVKKTVFGLIRRIAGSDPLPKSPNVSDCRRCDIACCDVRMPEPAPEVVTQEF